MLLRQSRVRSHRVEARATSLRDDAKRARFFSTCTVENAPGAQAIAGLLRRYLQSARMRLTIMITAISSLLLGALGVLPAAAEPPAVIMDPTRTSAVTMTNAWTTYAGVAIAQVYGDVVCLGFVNNGPRVAKKVGFSLAYADATGTVLGVEVMFPTGTFGVGKRAGTSVGRPAVNPFNNGNCHMADGSPTTSTFPYYSHGKKMGEAAAIFVSVREIVYDDGTAFRSDDVPKTGDHVDLTAVPVPAPERPVGPPLVSVNHMASAIDIDDVVTFGEFHEFCWTAHNRGDAKITTAKVGFLLVDRSGTIARIEESTATGNFAPGNTIGRSSTCTRLPGRLATDDYRMDGEDPSSVIGRIVVVPLDVTIEGGTVIPNKLAPKVGERIVLDRPHPAGTPKP